MNSKERIRNVVAGFSLTIALFLGGLGVAFGGTPYRIFGSFSLIFAFLFNFLAIALMLMSMREQAKEETLDKDKLRKMIEEGTLKQYLRDIEQEKLT